MIEKFLEAAKLGDTAIVIELLDSGVDVNAGDSTNTTALMRAAGFGHTELIRVLLDRGAALSPVNRMCYTALTCALLRSRTYRGFRTNPRPDPGPLELLLAAGDRFRLYEAVLLNDVDLARVRLDEGADPDTGEGSYDGPLLKLAAEMGSVEMVDLLLDRGANIEATDDLGQRPLLSAARCGHLEVVTRLLERGAELDAVGWSNESALANAAIEGHREIVGLLLSRGARRGIVDALALGDESILTVLLDEELNAGADIDWIGDARYRIALLAAGRGNPAIIRILLDRGAAQLWKHDDHSLLAEAVRHGHVEVARLLIDRGADLHAVGGDGLTPLAWAIREDQDEATRLLKASGASR